ncbi:glycosyl transferase [Skermanella stibiiresistens SB22]|uniref:Glycosyl transferase n=1 Tax=Skermanella stibiiresistens SB22 TaxID=1385369 RepID=W9H296_9PROT|nr:glycosyltransferase family 4 protein [Skermanella stibiiresistens]EWY38837.1 glycosyl transferase [Skermanella stibiiresistens SB22]
MKDLAGRFSSRGWRVTVLAQGAVDAPHEALAGVAVVRSGEPGGRRVPGGLGYLMALGGLWRAAKRLPRHDVVVTMTDPPMLASLGPPLGRRWGCGVINWSHDLYPDLLPVIDVKLTDAAMASLRWLALASLRRCDAVVAIGDCMAARLARDGVPASRIVTIPNWADPVVAPVPWSGNPMRDALGLGDRFTVAYSGNFGLAHPLDAVLEAAADLAVRAPDVMFLLIGEGRGLKRIKSALDRMALRNVLALPWQPAANLSVSLGAADLHLAAMDARAEGMLVPSKIAGALAAGRPCVLLGPAGGAAAKLLTENGCGEVVAPGDATRLATVILAHANDPSFHRAARAKAAAAAALWSADQAADAFLALAAAIARPARSGPRLVGRPPPRSLAAGGD